MSDFTYEKLRKHIFEDLNPRVKDFRKTVSDINRPFKSMELGISVWHPDKIFEANLGGIDAKSYIGYSRLEGKWGLIVRTIERDQESQAYVGQRLVPIESGNNMEVVVHALKKVPDLMQRIQETVGRQIATIEKLDDELSRLRDPDCRF